MAVALAGTLVISAAVLSTAALWALLAAEPSHEHVGQMRAAHPDLTVNDAIPLVCFVPLSRRGAANVFALPGAPHVKPEAVLRQLSGVPGSHTGPGVSSETSVAFYALLARRDRGAFRRLMLHGGGLGARLYGGCGLYLLGASSETEDFFTEMRDSDDVVETYSGCIVGETPVSELVRSVGEYVESLP